MSEKKIPITLSIEKSKLMLLQKMSKEKKMTVQNVIRKILNKNLN